MQRELLVAPVELDKVPPEAMAMHYLAALSASTTDGLGTQGYISQLAHIKEQVDSENKKGK